MVALREQARLHPVERLRPSLKSLFLAMWRLLRRHPLVVIGAVLIAADLGFIAIQIAVDATDYGFKGAYRLSLETEMGVAQFYGWVKAGAAAFLLYRAWRRFSSPVAGMWAAALAYLGTDDALRLHEKLGAYFAERFEFGEIGPLERGQDTGELLAYTLILAIALTALVVAERRDQGRFPSMLTAIMVPIVGAFLFFAVVIDSIHVLPHVLHIAVEDGGELLMLSVIFLTSIMWLHQTDELAIESGPRRTP